VRVVIKPTETSAVPSVVEPGAISRRPVAGALCTGRIGVHLGAASCGVWCVPVHQQARESALRWTL